MHNPLFFLFVPSFLCLSLPLLRVEAIYPVPNLNMHDSRVKSLFQYAAKVESMFFDNASSRVSFKNWMWLISILTDLILMSMCALFCTVGGLLSEISRKDLSY